MKRIPLTLIPLAFLLTLSASAQDLSGFVFKQPPAENPTAKKAREDHERGQYYLQSIGTNWVRVVDGKTNRLRFDPGWITIPEYSPYDDHSYSYHTFKVEIVCTNGVIVADTDRSGHGPSHNRSKFPDVTKYFLLRNWPGAGKALTGDPVVDASVRVTGPGQPPMRVMQVGRTNYFGETIPIYDYGTPIMITNAPTHSPR
jgi:hypothetical protein